MSPSPNLDAAKAREGCIQIVYTEDIRAPGVKLIRACDGGGFSLVAEGDHGVYAGGAARWHPRCQKRQNAEKHRNQGISQRVERAGFEEEAAHEPRSCDGSGYAQSGAGDSKPETLTEDQLGDLNTVGAERKAEADLAGSPAYGVGDEAVDADGADHDGQHSECGEKHGERARRGGGRDDDALQRADLGDWHRRIELGDQAAKGA